MIARRIEVATAARRYLVCMGGSFADLLAGEATSGTGPAGRQFRIALAVVDETVWQLHGERIRSALGEAGLPAEVEVVPSGEASKSPERYLSLCRALHRRQLDRSAAVLAIGGGVVLDLAGFVSATYLRGIDWIAVPTTLLAIADASVGGKTGIDFEGGKNLLGSFHQPSAVLVDFSFLETLPLRDYAAGLAEVVKAAIVRDRDLFQEIEGNPRALLSPDEHTLGVLARAVGIKAEIVGADERERGERAVLNFGHTIGHALESATGFGRWLHGEAVAIGMVCAAALSVEVVGLPAAEAGRIEHCLAELGLPVADPDTSLESVREWLGRDKKRVRGTTRFVLTPRIGSASFGHQLPQVIVNNTVARFIGRRS